MFLWLLFFAFPKTIFATISFTIDNPVKEGDYFIVDASISGISSASAYVFGMFTNKENPDYFGFTWGQKEDWVEYQTTNKDFITTNLPILLRDTVQKIWIKPNFSNSGYKGPGEYFLKLKRFTGASDSSAGESNTLTVTLLESTPTPTPTATAIPTPEPSITLNPTKTPTPTPVKTSTPTQAPTPTATLIVTKKITPTVSIYETPTQAISSASSFAVLGSSTTSSSLSTATPDTLVPETSSNNSILKYTFIFGVIISAVSGGFLYFRHRNS